MDPIRCRSILACVERFAFCFLTLVLGCAPTSPKIKLVVAPNVPKPAGLVTVLLEGQILFDGNPEYVPRTVGQKKTESTTLTIRYEYDDVHERHESRAPIYLLNNEQPPGMKMTTVFGRLKVLDGEKTLKIYEAVALLSAPIEKGQTMTVMRKQGSLAVRDSIEGQMYQDRAFLQGLQQ